MYNRRYFKHRYRLTGKPSFIFGLVLAAFFIIGLALVISGFCSMSAHAASQANAPASSRETATLLTGKLLSSISTTGTSETSQSTPPAKPGNDWRLVLVNSTHPLPAGFSVKTTALPNGLPFDAKAYDDLMKMMRDGKAQNLAFVICSAYRSIAKQQELFDEQVSIEQGNGKTKEQAIETTKTKVAWPGTSEHNLGLAVDIVALSYQKLDQGYLDTPECKWLQENSCKYGFIMRYPQDKSDITKIIFEPWHYRYVGVEAATQIKQQGLCLEEYLSEVD